MKVSILLLNQFVWKKSTYVCNCFVKPFEDDGKCWRGLIDLCVMKPFIDEGES
jgi:hypothetical protein